MKFVGDVRLFGLSFFVAASLLPPCSSLQGADPVTFVIEAEDFNYGGGQHRPEADSMPYYGGAYNGLSAVDNVDYHRDNDNSSGEYRQGEVPDVPMNAGQDLDRGDWVVTTNYKLGWINAGYWFNYTRQVPQGFYRVYAGLSHGNTGPTDLRGSLAEVTSGATTTSQTLKPLGTFLAPGTGEWGGNALVPLKDDQGDSVLLDLNGTTTFRFTTGSGDFDYIKLVKTGPPQIAEHPVDLTVTESRPATFTVTLGNEDPAEYQWQKNRVNIPGATEEVVVLRPSLADNGALIRVVLTNPLGTTISQEATLTVERDSERPTLVQALNSTPTVILVRFDEPVSVPSGAAADYFSVSGGVSALSATAGSEATDILLAVDHLVFGTTYVVTVSGVSDTAALPNMVVPNSTVSFTASEYAPTDIGDPTQAGSVLRLPGGVFEVTGGGMTTDGTRDQMQFGWESRTGNFDIQARVTEVRVTDAFLKAGLMARETLDSNSRYVAAFASSVQVGCFFESRSGTGAASVTAAPSGGFPVNYPQTWLRLRRTAGTLIGYGSVDGVTWVQLGSVTLSGLPSTLFFGLAVSSENQTQVTTARFENLGTTTSPAVGSLPRPGREPLSHSSRATGLVFSEIMYHPADRADSRQLEFVEIYNARLTPEDLTGYRLSGDIDFRFPDGLILQPGQFVVVAAAPADLQTVYGLENVLGPFTNSLPNAAGRVRLRDAFDAVRLEVNYEDDRPWPLAADGAGHSLVLARPSYGEDSPKAWSASELIGGSPGQMDALFPSPLRQVVINEFLAHTDDPQWDFVELYNHSNQPVDISGCILTDDIRTNRFVIPANTTIPARGLLSFDQWELGFALSATGEEIYFLDSGRTRVLDAVRFEGQENGVSTGRSPDGSELFRRLAQVTPGASNSPRRSEAIVVSEIMYHPLSESEDEEYVELYNRSGAPIDLTDWRLREGVDYRFPTNAVIAAGTYLVVAKNATNLIARYPQLTGANTLGDYSGVLADGGERIVLTKPDTVTSTNSVGNLETNTIHIAIADITYEDGGRWGTWSDGGGSSLELIDLAADPVHPSSWADSDETQKASWTTASFTGPLDLGNGYNPDRFHILMQGPGECMIDDVVMARSGGANLISNNGFESGTAGWTLQGNHSTSSVEVGAGYGGTRGLHVRGQGDGDPGINSIRTALAAGLSAGNTGTIQARVRWLAGWPQVLFKTRGGWIELSADLPVPTHLGTPGLANSRAVANAGPAVFNVAHFPLLPQPGQAVVVTCQVSDLDGLSLLQLRYRTDPSTSYSVLTMADNGVSGDEIAGDGIYSATISGRSSGTLIGFNIRARDAAASPNTTQFPAIALVQDPVQECLIRWGDAIPSGSMTHYHLWSTSATENALNSTYGLNNTWRNATLVYGSSRAIYNVNFRDKGSPYHAGRGDYAVSVPKDDLLLGATDRIFASTGNGGSEATGIRSQLAGWLGQQLDIPYLHASYMQLFRNGSQFRNVSEDLEQPNHSYSQRWFPGDEGDLYKTSIWFEFQDNNSDFARTDATLQSLKSGVDYKLGRYRWNWQRRSNDGDANNFANLFELVTAANDGSASFVPNLLQIADIEEWMRVHGYNRVMGNWDAWTYNVGQNMFIYKQPGLRWVIMPWDVDFTFGAGDGATGSLWGGQDPVGNRFYDTPAFRRMLWRLFIDAVNGPMLPENFGPQIEVRRRALLKNGVTGLADPAPIYSYLEGRRDYLLGQIRANDASGFSITSNGGNGYQSQTPTTTLQGIAPFAVATIEVNGVPYPATWTDYTRFSVTVPLTDAVNVLTLVGLDRKGQPISGLTDTITVTYPGAIQQPEDYLVLSEVHYNPYEPGSSFLEIYNRSTTTPFDLSFFRLNGVGYTFPVGTILQPRSYLVLVNDRAAFVAVYGDTIPILDEFPGSLDNNGERVALYRPGSTPAEEILVSDVRYSDLPPWPVAADGQGASLQIIDVSKDSYRVGNWAAADTNSVNRTTPGRANVVSTTLATFPKVWLNEVMPDNQTGARDGAGDLDPWIELHNTGTTGVNLSAYYLTDDFTDLTRWQFPSGTIIGAGEFLLVWLDGETGESSAVEPHTNFRIDPSSGSVALVRMQGIGPVPAVMDYLDYALLPLDRSFGSYPDGEPRQRRLFHYVTPGLANDPNTPVIQVTINELMAGNTTTVQDLADGDYDDWFELHNAGSEPVDLTSYSLTDSLLNPDQHIIPSGTIIPAGGFLLVWADDETDQMSGEGTMHVNFKLSLDGEELGLFAPDGSQVDAVSFGVQRNDASIGRFPDGSLNQLLDMDAPSPGAANLLAGGNIPPTLDFIEDRTVNEQSLLTFTATASDSDATQILSFSLGSGAPVEASIDNQTGLFSWGPSEADGPGTYPIVVRVTDNGVPARTTTQQFLVEVREVNRAPQFSAVQTQVIGEGNLFTYSLSATDADLPANNLTYRLGSNPPVGLELDPSTGVINWIPDESQGPSNHSVTVEVLDDGSPVLSDSLTFSVQVNEVDNPPVFDAVPSQQVDEMTPFRFVVAATDPDSPPSALLYQLDVHPAGAVINQNTGEIQWTPTEAQGPTNAVFVVRATEDVGAGDGMSSTVTFSVQVAEVNQPPTIDAVPDQVLAEGDVLALSLVARDYDQPAQSLSFSLDPGAPAGMTVDADTGFLVWSIGNDVGVIDQEVSVRVSDGQLPPGVAVETFRVTVVRAPHVVINEIMVSPGVAGAQFVELYNNSTNAAEALEGVTLIGRSLSYTFPTGTVLSPDGYLVIAQDEAIAAAAYPAATVAGVFSGSIQPHAETLSLIRPGATPAEDVLLDEVGFSAEQPWPPAMTQGSSLQLIDPLEDNRRVSNWDAILGVSTTGSVEVVTFVGNWRYDESGSDLGTSWRESGYPDSGWLEGPGLLYVENADLPEPKGTPLNLGPITFYFRTHFEYLGATVGASLNLSTILDDGAVFYLNGEEIMRLGMDDTPFDAGTGANRVVGDAILEGPFVLPATALKRGDNVLAVEVHQTSDTSSDVVMGTSLSVEGGDVEPYTPGYRNSVYADLPPHPPVWLNEIVAINTQSGADAQGQYAAWVELFNAGSLPESLDGYYLSDNYASLARWKLPSAPELAPGEYRLVWLDGDLTENTPDEWHAAIRITQPTGSIVLTHLDNQVFTIVDYLNFDGLQADEAYGNLIDGHSPYRGILANPTPGASNQAALPGLWLTDVIMGQDGRIYLSWPVESGAQYEVQYRDEVADTGWQSAGTPVVADGMATFSEAAFTGPGHRFYRFRRLD